LNQPLNIETQLLQLKQKLYDLSGRNPFINVNPKNLWLVDSEDSTQAIKLYKKQQLFKKEYGLDTVLYVTHFIKWKSIKKDKYYISPLIYQPAKITKNQKISLTFDWITEAENYLINPIIIDEFSTQFNIDLNTTIEDSNNFIFNLSQQLEQNGDIIQQIASFNDKNEWQIITLNSIGCFNYKKSVLAKDYKTIQTNPNLSVKNLLGDDIKPKIESTHQTSILPLSDAAQKKAIVTALHQNLVIQGPPGTGKSHTIAELIKHNLLQGKKVLFVSEKKSALDVVYQKLTNDNLTHLIAYFNAEKNQKKTFYHHLKQSITHPIVLTKKRVNTVRLKELTQFFKSYSQHLTDNTKANVSLYDLIKYLAKHQVKDLEFDTKTKIPSYSDWFKYLTFFEDIEVIGKKNYKINTISELPFIRFNKSAFLGDNPLSKIETRLNELSDWQQKINLVLKPYKFNWTWSELNKYCVTASVLNLANKSQLAILDPNDKTFKTFNTWSKKYELTKNKLEQSNLLCEKWLIKPKLADIDQLLDSITHGKQSKWLSFFKTSNVDTAFKQYNGNLSDDLKIKALQNLKKQYELKHELDAITIKLKHNLNILDPDTEINILFRLRQKLNDLNPNHYVFILEHPNSIQLINTLHELHPLIQQSNQIVKFLFTDYKITSIEKFKTDLSQIKSHSPKFIHLIPEIKKTLNIQSDILNFIRHNNLNVKKLTDLVVYHNYIELLRFYPQLKELESINILPNFTLLENLKHEKNSQIIEDIKLLWTEKHNKKEALVLIPNSKLTDEEKLAKKTEKQSKRLIYHEIAKQQQHLPIKELVKKTNYTIFDNLPLWMMNPLTIAENLPCDANLFDVIIFDESSQIPLEDAIPAVYRAKHIVVVGDDKQMPPSQFFSSSTNSTTLLNQANSVFNSHLLTWHYRSQHPKLMQFSNSNFYDNELCYFPAVSSQSPIEHLYIKNGLFENGVNSLEAKAVAQQYKILLNKGLKNIGIIAFSKTQEDHIKKEITSLNLTDNDELLIKNLENVQGVERDIIIISIGYGFNSEGVFRLNFGPINQDFGANRLNVLLTRAKQKMIICTSVKSSDFKLSNNKGVQLLREFLRFTEKQIEQIPDLPLQFILKTTSVILKDQPSIQFYKSINGLAINCFIEHDSQKILLIDPCLHPNENQDIYTVLSVLNNRFKSIKIALSHDYWHNKERFKIDVINYFSE